MTMREKLIELQDSGNICPKGITNCFECPYYKEYAFGIPCDEKAAIADRMIANGVTIQKWIPVSDRLPELIPCNAGTAYSEAVIVWTDNRKAMIAVWDGIDFLCAADYWEAWGENITHWMPLPEPPKEVE